jgi:hypothetical protein
MDANNSLKFDVDLDFSSLLPGSCTISTLWIIKLCYPAQTEILTNTLGDPDQTKPATDASGAGATTTFTLLL